MKHKTKNVSSIVSIVKKMKNHAIYSKEHAKLKKQLVRVGIKILRKEIPNYKPYTKLVLKIISIRQIFASNTIN